MHINSIIKTTRLALRTLGKEDVSDSYLGWMRDYEVIRCLESRFSIPAGKSDLESFIKSANDSPNSVSYTHLTLPTIYSV